MSRRTIHGKDDLIVPLSQRATGNVPSDATIRCYLDVEYLYKEAVDREIQIDKDKKASGNAFPLNARNEGHKETIARYRGCSEWYQWHETQGPAWHYDRRLNEMEEKERREWEYRMEQDSRKFQQELAEKAEETQIEIGRTARSQLGWSIVAIAVSVALTFAATLITIRCTEANVEITSPVPVVVEEGTPTPAP
jgi:hypothetical protein